MDNYTRQEEVTYDYPPEFRMQILALLLKNTWLVTYGYLINPAYFPEEIERNIATSILKHKNIYGSAPSLGDLSVEHPSETAYLTNIFHMSVNYDLNKTSEMVLDWAKDSSMRLALMGSIDDLEAGNLHAIRERITRAMQVGVDYNDIGLDLLSDSSLWMQDIQNSNKVRFPWPEVNGITDGGLDAGELGIIIAPAGGYKTTSLVNIGVAAAGHINKKNVLHFSLEMSEQKVLRRYAARVTNEFYKSNSNSKEYSELLEQSYKKMIRGSIRVKRYLSHQATVNDLKDFVIRLRDTGYNIDTVIVDYPDLLRANRKFAERRFELQEIYENLRGVAIDLDVPIWGATQSNRESLTKKIITIENLAEDMGKAWTSDIMIAVCQTKDEKDANEARLFMAKVRDGDIAGKSQIKLNIRYPAMISCGFVNNNEDKENERDDEFGWK